MADAKTVTLHHPAFENVSQEVPAGDVDNWTAAGWLQSPAEEVTD